MAVSQEETRLKGMIMERETKIKELEELNSAKNKQIKTLTEQISKLKTDKLLSTTEEDVIKKILSYFAKGYQFSLILEKLRFNAYDIDMEKIRQICLNIEDMDNKYILYYKEQVKAYEESIKINPELLKDNLIQKFQLLINDASEDLVKIESIEEKRKLREEIKGHMKEMNAVLKNVIDDKNGITAEEIFSSMETIDKLNKTVRFVIKEEEIMN